MSDIFSHPILALIQERALIDDLQLEEVVQEATRSGKPVVQILQDLGLMDIDTILQITADHLGTEVADLRDREIDPETLKIVPAETARMYQAIPLAIFGNAAQIAMADPLNPAILDEIGFITGKELQVVVADPKQIDQA